MPVSTFDQTAIASALKEYYAKREVQDTLYNADNYKLVKGANKVNALKSAKAVGKKYISPIKYGRNMSTGSTRAAAQDSATAAKYEAWEVTPIVFNWSAYIDRTALKMAEQKGEGAYFDLVKEAIDDARMAATEELEHAAWRNKNRARGVVGSVSTTSLVLANKADIVNFQLGMQVQAAATEGGTLRDSGDYITIAGLDATTGTLVGDANWSNIASIAAGDFLFKKGQQTTGLNGLAAHLPTTRSGTVTVQGVDVNTDWARLAGTYVNAAGKPISTGLVDGLHEAFRNGSKPKRIFTSASKFADLVNDSGNNKIFSSDSATVGFSSLKIAAPQGLLTIEPAEFCPDNLAYALPDGIELVHWGDQLIEFVDEDDQMLRIGSNTDVYEVRLASLVDMCVPNPKDCVVFAF